MRPRMIVDVVIFGVHIFLYSFGCFHFLRFYVFTFFFLCFFFVSNSIISNVSTCFCLCFIYLCFVFVPNFVFIFVLFHFFFVYFHSAPSKFRLHYTQVLKNQSKTFNLRFSLRNYQNQQSNCVWQFLSLFVLLSPSLCVIFPQAPRPGICG